QHKARKGGPANGDVDIAAGAGHDGDDNDDSSDSDGAAHHALAIRDQKALERAFAGDDVAAAFAAEKEAVVADEEDQLVDNSLPGWGSWGGRGVRKRKQPGGKKLDKTSPWVTKIEGVKRKNRKDARLARVIINE